jgi:uracil-DNA glycosylase
MNNLQINSKEIQTKLEKILSEKDWYTALKPFINSNDFTEIIDKLILEVENKKRFVPKLKDIFNPFMFCNLQDLKVVIIGQDPYPMLQTNNNLEQSVADGIAFSCSYTMKEQPLLTKIFDAIQSTDSSYERNPDLSRWSKQGVLLLNTALTTQLNKPGTHYEIWKPFLSFVLDYLYWNKTDLVFILMGKVAGEWEDLINDSNSLIIKTTHPVSASYNNTDWDCKNCFNRANKFLSDQGKDQIIW